MNVSNLPIRPMADPSVKRSESAAKVHKAAQDFEAIIIGQMLKSARESSFGGGGWGTGGDPAGDVAIEMAEQQMAQMLASNGGLGLARIVSKGLEKISKD